MMNILYCGDSNIKAGMILSIMSLLKNNSEPIKVYVLTMSLSTEKKEYFPLSDQVIDYTRGLLKEKDSRNDIVKIDVSESFQKEIPLINIETRFTPYCMLRLFADQVEEIPDKILYLDNDVLCRKSIEAFYKQDVSDWEFVGMLDFYGSWFFRRKFYKRDYCNSGVLLLNMAKIRQTGLFTNCRQMCLSKKMFMPDQSALNKLAIAKKIDKRCYNEQRRLHEDTVLQHFTTSFRLFPILHTITVKPWMFEEVHRVLKLKEYDWLFEAYRELEDIPQDVEKA